MLFITDILLILLHININGIFSKILYLISSFDNLLIILILPSLILYS